MIDKLEFVYDYSDQVCFGIYKDNDPMLPFSVGVDDTGGVLQEMLLTTAEAKALLKFLKKHLEPKLENV